MEKQKVLDELEKAFQDAKKRQFPNAKRLSGRMKGILDCIRVVREMKE